MSGAARIPRLLSALLLAAGLAAQGLKEQPVGLVLRVQECSLLRANTELALTARAGDILFTGDTLRAGSGPVSFLYCPENAIRTLAGGGEVTLEERQIRVRKGSLGDKLPAPRCFLPPMERAAAASQSHNGASLTRALAGETDPGTFATRLARLSESDRTAAVRELEPLDKAIAADPQDGPARLARAGVLEKYKLAYDAAEEYRRIATVWPEAAWLRARLFVLEEEAARPEKPPAEKGKTYALLVGVSAYMSERIRALNFAHEDALLLESYLRSARGGALAETDITVLINERATTAAVRNAFETFLKARAGKNDTVILLVAAHGVVVEKGKRGAYIVTHDSDPEDLESTALPMADIQKLIREDLSNVGQVLAFIDVCRSGTIGTIPKNAKVNNVVERLSEAEGQLFLFTASRANEFSFEGPQYGGGHGAFSFFLIEALNSAGDLDSDGRVTINELIEYTQTKVAEGTLNRQHPREGGNIDGATTMADTKLAGVVMKKFTPPAAGGQKLEEVALSRSLERTGGRTIRALVLREAVDFDEALTSGRVLPDAQRSAFTALRQLQLQRRVKPDEYLIHASRLQTDLEDRGQQVLLRYLRGDQAPQSRTDFAFGAAFFEAGRLLAPESLLLESRATFCLGRVALFDKDYPRAKALLERAVRLDSEGAYSYNALGIAYLEQADYPQAVAAFRDAIRRAPYWAYPLHNLALAYAELGDWGSAIRSYLEAIRLAPRYSYLHYNLGLVYQRLNRVKEAERSYGRAIELNPNEGMPYNAMGYLKASVGKQEDAERLYRQALAKTPDLLEAKHNLGVLLAARKDRFPEAEALWRQVLVRSAQFLPARLALARGLAAQGREREAAQEYDAVVTSKPDYVAARLALAGLRAKAGDRDAAREQLREALRRQPANALIHEQLGDLEKAAGRTAEAAAAYQAALRHAPEGATKKRIRRKM